MNSSYEVGNRGEELAAGYLKSQGYTILETNWVKNHKEIDIIALKDNKIHIVEVKTRSYTMGMEPKLFVTRQKQRNLIAGANSYVLQKNLDLDVVFDIISIVYQGSKITYEIVENAFYPLV